MTQLVGMQPESPVQYVHDVILPPFEHVCSCPDETRTTGLLACLLAAGYKIQVVGYSPLLMNYIHFNL